jgi:hypothetical protein
MKLYTMSVYTLFAPVQSLLHPSTIRAFLTGYGMDMALGCRSTDETTSIAIVVIAWITLLISHTTT